MFREFYGYKSNPCVHSKNQYTNVYTRVLTRVQLTFSREPSSNPPMDVGWVNLGYNPGWGRSHWRQIRVESLELSCKIGLVSRLVFFDFGN